MMNVSSRKRGCCLVAVMVGVLIFMGLTVCNAVAAPKVKELKWATFFPETDSEAVHLRLFRDDIEAYTHGAIKPKLYYAGQIAEVKDLPELCRRGAVEMTTCGPPSYPSIFPLNATLSMFALVFKHAEQVAYTWRGLLREFPEIQGEYAKQNHYCLNRAAFSVYITISKKPIRNLADLKGLKIRGHAGKYFAEFVRSVGATTTFLPPPEIYEGLMRGTVDAVMMTPQFCESMKLYEVAKYIGLPVGTNVGYHHTINLDVWNSFTPEIKKAFTRAALEWGKRDLEIHVTTAERSMQSLKQKGVQFLEFGQEDWKTWIAKGGDPWVGAKENAINELKVDAAVAERFIKRWRELVDEYEQRFLATGKRWEYR